MLQERSNGNLDGNGEVDWCTYYKLHYLYTRPYRVQTSENKGEGVATGYNVERMKGDMVRRDVV